MKHSVVIVGVGALGSHVVQLLRSTGAALKVIDFDRVEQKNTLSQFHPASSVGKNKVVALQGTMNLLFKTKIDGVPTKLTVDNTEQLLGGATLIIDCLDNAPSRQIIQDYVRLKTTPCLHGALDADGTYGRVVWDERFVIDSGSPVGTPTCENGEHLPFISITASFIARAAQVFLAKNEKMGFEVNPGGAIRT